VTDKVKR